MLRSSTCHEYAVVADVFVPSLLDGCFDSYSRLDIGRNDGVFILLILLIEQFPAGHADHPCDDPFFRQRLGGTQGNRDFRAGGQKQNVGFVGWDENVGALVNVVRRAVFVAPANISMSERFHWRRRDGRQAGSVSP